MKYYLPDHDQDPEDAWEIPKSKNQTADSYWAAQAAENYHHHHDGWEASWPLVFALIDDKGVETRWDVEQEVVPAFYAVRHKEKKK